MSIIPPIVSFSCSQYNPCRAIGVRKYL